MRLVANTGRDRTFDILNGLKRQTLDVLTDEVSIFGAHAALEAGPCTLARVLLGSSTDTLLTGETTDRVRRNRLQNRAISTALARALATAEVRQTRLPPSQSVLLTQRGAVLGNCSLTTAGLGIAPQSRLGFIQQTENDAELTMVRQWFEAEWNAANPQGPAVAALIEAVTVTSSEHAPRAVYTQALHQLFSEMQAGTDEARIVDSATGIRDTQIWSKLYRFQKDGVIGAIDKLQRFGGCIIADSVGLGKTFEALAVIKYFELRNARVLVLAPKRLRENWTLWTRNDVRNMLAADRFAFNVLNHTDLSREGGQSGDIDLGHINWGNYDLLVIDESHNFRNRPAGKGERESRYDKLLNAVVKAGVKTRVLMLSATPVNNRFNDLKNQLALAYEGDSEALSKRLRGDHDIDQIFRRAQAAFNAWSNLPAETRTATAILNSLDFDFFELLDSVTIARSRRHIETFYNTADIGRFPERRKPLSFHCALTQRDDVIGFNEIFDQLSLLKLAVYAPVSYILPSRLKKYEEMYDTQTEGGRGKLKQADREKSLQALMTTNLLKRLESSVEAFRLTLQSLQASHRSALEKITNFRKTGQESGFADVSAAFEDVDFDDDSLPVPGDFSIGKKITINLADMDLPSWEQDLQTDLLYIDELLGEMHKVTPADDAKLQHLKTQIASKLASPINPGNRKVLIFTAFADTANYLYDNLASDLQRHHQVHTGKVTGSDAPKSTLGNMPGSRQSYDFQGLLTLFSPRSKEKAAIYPDEPREIDILIGTDCISEGQNLQDCDYLINYDIHWNPVRIIQRFGRVDRIGSQNASIQLVNYWPDISLDEYINLKERVENRMMIADVTATGDDNVLNAQANDVAYRKEQLRRLQDEVIEMEDLKTGVSITDLGLNDFRMDLLNYIKQHGELDHLPNGLHAVVPARPEMGLLPGVIFTLRNRNHGVDINQQNRLYPYYLIYIGTDGRVISDHTEAKRLLDLARSACKGYNQPIAEAYQRFNQATDDGRQMQAYSNLLDQAIRAMIEVQEEKDIDSLFSGGRTTALCDSITGLDDFELIAFVVVI